MKAILHGGPFDGKEMTVADGQLELHMEDNATNSRLQVVRYVLHYTDKRDVRHYYVPTSSSAPGSRK